MLHNTKEISLHVENLPGNELDFCFYSGEMIIQSAQLAYYLNFDLAEGNDRQKENIINTPPGVQGTNLLLSDIMTTEF